MFSASNEEERRLENVEGPISRDNQCMLDCMNLTFVAQEQHVDRTNHPTILEDCKVLTIIPAAVCSPYLLRIDTN